MLVTLILFILFNEFISEERKNDLLLNWAKILEENYIIIIITVVVAPVSRPFSVEHTRWLSHRLQSKIVESENIFYNTVYSIQLHDEQSGEDVLARLEGKPKTKAINLNGGIVFREPKQLIVTPWHYYRTNFIQIQKCMMDIPWCLESSTAYNNNKNNNERFSTI